MRGAGRQLLASILNLITYWVLGLPLAILLGVYFNFGVEGLWWALCITTSVQVRTAYEPLGRCIVGYMHGIIHSTHAAWLICLQTPYGNQIADVREFGKIMSRQHPRNVMTDVRVVSKRR